MRYFTLSFFSVLSCLTFNASAANVTVKWLGAVPSIGCSSRPITNQISFKTLNEECNSEFKIEDQTKTENKGTGKKIVTFDI